MSENAVRNRNIAIALLLGIILVVGGFWAVNNVDFGGADITVEPTPESACVEYGEIFQMVCTDNETNAVLVSLGNAPDPSVVVTVTYEGLTVSGDSDAILERFVDVEPEIEVVSTPTPTTAHTMTDTLAVNEPSDVRLIEVDVAFWGFPGISGMYRYAGQGNEQECTLQVGCEVFGDPGVIAEEVRTGNPSAILITPDSQYQLTSSIARSDIPEGGYWSFSGSALTADFTALINGEVVEAGFRLPSIPNHEWQVYIRGVVPGDGDFNTPIYLSDYHEGFSLVTVYDLGGEAETSGGFFSQEYMEQQVTNTMQNNCGGGDCWYGVTVVVIDLNNLSLSTMIYDYTDDFPVMDSPVYSSLDTNLHEYQGR